MGDAAVNKSSSIETTIFCLKMNTHNEKDDELVTGGDDNPSEDGEAALLTT